MTKVGATARTGDFVRSAEGGIYVKLRVSPGAKSTAVKGLYGEDAVRLSVAAPPTEGRANAEIERYLAQLFSISRADVAVVKGASSRDKLVFLSGTKPEAVREGLVNLVS